ncbi:NAD(P)H-hydrate dehydratase [Flavobacterium sp. SM15]|uniref:NAD(P)H-hydrate dehydratase n=1 Tax=Flavobacterium sp. SM15 TaxID=2908005 RepID=UPI001EDB2CBB|nr:NAD(P)H-hydrate dehydratase [Flavobacterium sp. SM15]MCG2611535.1 NAD(P)H-hydrate dehydratase [Flavobacterium sp. SM15]
MEKHILIDHQEVLKRFRPISENSHKGVQGHALIVGGSYGKIGSVCLSAKACLKSGAGLVSAYIPKCGYDVVQSVVPEVMVLTDDYYEHITSINHKLSLQSIGIGMGIGQHLETQQAMFHFLKMNSAPMVIDADGLNILSENKEWLEMLPKQTILTPHLKELRRLIGDWNSDGEMLEKVISYSCKYNLIVVVKGAPTLIVNGEKIYQNTSGNQALATAGSGDVLTGIITGFLAQDYAPVDAAILAVYLHGLSANLGAVEIGHHSFIASDIINYLGKAFLTLK